MVYGMVHNISKKYTFFKNKNVYVKIHFTLLIYFIKKYVWYIVEVFFWYDFAN